MDTPWKTFMRIVRWALGEAWEKINVVETWRELKKLGKKHGRRFFVVAVLWEFIEDVVFPLISWKMGVPELIPLFLIMHFEPLVYPAFFWAFRMWDRSQGREPWEPDRAAQSAYWRSAMKVVVYKLAVSGWLLALLLVLGRSPAVMVAYIGLMAAFGFVHERVWHDSNYGIGEDDHVGRKRVFAKTATYCFVSMMLLYPLFRVSFGAVPWRVLLACQGTGSALYLVFESVWAKSTWGVTPVVRPPVDRLPDGALPIYD